MDIYDQFSRCEFLDQAIEDQFGERTPEFISIMSEYYDETMTEMFEVVFIAEDRVMLAHMQNHDRYEVGGIASEVLERLEPGDVFHMILAREDQDWYVLWMSGVYESIEWANDDEVYH